MAGKRISANVPAQTHPEVTERTAGPEPRGGICDSGEDTSVADQRWFEDMAILRRAAAELAEGRTAAKTSAPWLARDDSFYGFVEALGYSSEEHRNAAIRRLYDNNPERAASFFNMALRESSPEGKRKLGAALIGSGLVSDAINSLIGQGGKDSYSALSLLFLAAKAGEIQPLVRAIENHPSVELRQKLIGLLVSSGENESLRSLRTLPVGKTLPWNCV